MTSRNPERDAAILALLRAGERHVAVGARFGLSTTRLQQIRLRETGLSLDLPPTEGAAERARVAPVPAPAVHGKGLGGNPADLTGMVFGFLEPLAPLPRDNRQGRVWLCGCWRCGRTTEARVKDLLSGNTTSCGCYKAERGRSAEWLAHYPAVEAAVWGMLDAGDDLRDLSALRRRFVQPRGPLAYTTFYRYVKRAQAVHNKPGGRDRLKPLAPPP